MAQSKGGKDLRRCCECRHWYTPAPSAANTQMTCSEKCRLRRRAKQEKARRETDLPSCRVADRVRQRKHRANEEAEARPLSQAGLSPQVAESIDKIINKLGHAQRLSQTGLRRQLYRLAQAGRGEIEPKSAKVWT